MDSAKKIGLVVIVCFTMLGAGSCYQLMPTSQVKQFSSYFLYPVIVCQSYLVRPVKHWFEDKKSNDVLHHEVKVLKEKYAQARGEAQSLRAQLSFLEQTKDLTRFKKRFGHKDATMVQVIGVHSSEKEHYLLIDAGSSRGVEPEMVAIYHNNLVGKVTEVFPWYSKVTLITDRSCKVAAYCAKTGSHGIHEGRNIINGTSLKYVSHLGAVEEGDVVLSSGKGLVFPKGFVLGTIAATQQQGLHHEIDVTPSCDVEDICYCLLLSKRELQS